MNENSLESGVVEMLAEISKRNPGGLDVCLRLIDAFGALAAFDFALLKQMGILGADLYCLFKDCDGDINALHASLMEQTALEKLRSVRGSKFYQPAEIEK